LAEEKHQNKAQETKELIDFAKSNNNLGLIIEDLHDENVLTAEGIQRRHFHNCSIPTGVFNILKAS